MFRKPMRLEKWIAFDGAFVEVLDAAHDADADAGADSRNGASHYDGGIHDTDGASNSDDASETMMPAGFAPASISESSTDIIYHEYGSGLWWQLEIGMPNDISTNGQDSFMPFWGNSDVIFQLLDKPANATVYSTDFVLNVSKPNGGSFSFYTATDVGVVNGSIDLNLSNDFITQNGLLEGQFLAYTTDVPLSSGLYELNIVRVITAGNGNLIFRAESGYTFYCNTTDEGNVQFTATRNNSNSFAVFGHILQSLIFTSDTAAIPEKVSGFTIGVFFSTKATLNMDTLYKWFNDPQDADYFFGDEALGGITVNNPGGGIVPDPGPDPDPGSNPDPGPDPDPDPDPDLDPDPDPDPDPQDPDPITPPVTDGGKDGEANGDGGNIPDTGDIGSDASDAQGSDNGESGDAADGGGDAGSGDPLAYIYRREEEFVEETGLVGSRDPDAVEAEMIAIEDRIVESASAGAALELLRDMESMLQTVRGERDILEFVLGRLHQEYLLRNASEWGELRDELRRLFESGSLEKEAINRILGEMNRQLGGYRRISAEHRDGMLMESLRELMDSAERRSGETGALAKALGAVVNMLSNSRQHGDVPPTKAELSELFDATLAAAREQWLAKASHSDPMGKELAATTE